MARTEVLKHFWGTSMIKKYVGLTFYLSFLLMASCGKGELVDNSSSQDAMINISLRQVLDYDSETVSVRFSGNLNLDAFPSTDRVHFYRDTSCSLEIGSVLVSDFEAQGVELNVPQGQNSVPIYFSSVALSECNFLESYDYGALSPSEPVFTRVVPATPNRLSTTPGLFGEVFPAHSAVEIFDDALCTNRLASGTAEQFENSGISVAVGENTVTTLYARVTDSLSNISNCVEMISYEHSNTLSDPPVLLGISPTSPSNQSFRPFVRGTAATDAVTVSVYSDSGCSNELASGTPSSFSSPGLQIQANENGLIEIYAQTINAEMQPSVCSRLGEFIHDSLPPASPSFTSISPISPNNQSTSPLITGTSSSDTETIEFFSDQTCVNRIGLGSKSNFEGSGVAAGVENNASTIIYAMAFDAAGNGSGCVEFTTYTHNTIAPAPPVFQAFDPPSPTNQTTTPNIGGLTSARTLVVNVYDDGMCSNLIGTGSYSDFESTSIQITTRANDSTDVYLTAVDFEGNESSCFSAATYEHSTQAAPDPVFTRTIPDSPSNSSINPLVIGNADSSVETVSLYSDSGCSSLLGSSSRVSFLSSGISVNLNANSVNPIYAQARDEFGNNSSCSLLTSYTHVDEPPLNPNFMSVSPTTPNNQSASPVLFGQALQNMASLLPPEEIIFYNSPSCVTRVGQGPVTNFPSGIQVSVPENAESVIYGRVFDEAGNRSDCTFLTEYVNNNLEPSVPQFVSTIAASPSFTDEIRVFGSYAFSPDFMNRVSLSFYDDSSCTNQLTSGDPNLLNTSGFNLTVPLNQVTSLYARSTNEVGTQSSCGFMTNFRHYDLAPTNLSLQSAPDGSIRINWLPDNISQPQPTYTIERSTELMGPYSVMASSLLSVSYTDVNVTEGETYYYRVYATNTTGRSQYSTPESLTVSAPSATEINNLQASAENLQIRLTWSGFPENTKYLIYRSEQSGGPFDNLILQTTQSSYTDSNVVNDTTYYYVVKALNPSGLSMKSNVASATPIDSPPRIENFTLTPFRDSRVCSGTPGFKASWNAQSHFTSYTLNRSRQKDQVGTTLSSTGQNFIRVCNYNSFDDGLYYVNATTLWNGGVQLVSNSIGFSRRNSPNLTVNAGENEVVLQWTASSNPNVLSGRTIFYDLYSSSDPDKEFQVLSSGMTGVSYIDNILNGDAKFYYVQAYTTDTEGVRVYLGAPSAVVSARPSAPPSQPTNLVIMYDNDQPIRLSWSAPSHYNGFAIYRSQSALGPFSEVAYVANSFFDIAGEPVGLNYYYVRTVWGTQESADSNTVNLRVAPINGLNAQSNASEIQLNWAAVLGVQDYVVYRDTKIDGNFSTSFVVTTNSFTDSSVSAGQGYYYKVKARFADGSEGVLSEVVSATLEGETLPTSLSLVRSQAGVVEAHWVPVEEAVSYQVYTSQNALGPFNLASSTFNSSVNLFGLLPLREYFVRVDYTFNTVTYSSTVESIYTLPDVQVPSVTPGDSQVGLSWSPSAGASSYNVFRSNDGGQSFSLLVSNFPTNTYTDSGVTNGDLYFYRLEANFAGPYTRQSSTSLGVTPGVVPLTPVGLIAENNGSGTAVDLSWSRVEGVNRYAVYESTTPGVYGTPKLETGSNYRLRVTGLSEGQVYYYSVKALNGSLESPFSNEVSVFTSRERVKPDALYSSPTEVEVSWPVDPQAGSYEVYRSVDDYKYERVATGLSVNQYIDSTVDNQKTYFYKYSVVTAANVESSLSAPSDPITLSSEPLAPQNLTVSEASLSEVRLEWSKSPNVDSYEILRSNTSGSGYLSLATVDSTNNFFVDSAVSSSQSYYYVVRSLTRSEVPSPFSNEASTILTVGPSGLAAVDSEGEVNLSWSTLPGVSSYQIYRAEEASGPFGRVGGSALESFSDSEVITAKSYYYKVYGVFLDGRKTLSSNTVNINVSGFLDFKVSVDLLDRPLASSQASSVVFNRTQTTYNPEDYDGVSSITFKVLASNADTVDREVLLLDSNDFIIGSVIVPQQTFDPILIESSTLTMNPSEDVYKLAIEQTTIDTQVNVLSAKMNIYQVDATKTKIYYPLLTTERPPTNEDLTGEILSTFQTGYQSYLESIIYKRETLNQSRLLAFNSWEIESLVSSTHGSSGSMVLRNLDTAEDIEGSETVIEQGLITVAKTYLNEGVSGLSPSNENDHYELLLRCNSRCESGEVKVYKSGLWLKLENLTQLRLHERLTHLKSGVGSDTDFTDERLSLDSNDFLSPTFYHRTITNESSSSSAELELVHHSDLFGSSNLTPQNSSLVLADFDQKQVATSSAFVPTDGDNYVLRLRPMSGSVDLVSSFIVIDVN